MFNLNVLVDFLKDLRGVIPEPARSEIAHRMADLVSTMIKDAGGEAYRQWVYLDRLRFLCRCELIACERWVPDDLAVNPTQLADFCNRWMSCDLFKLRNDSAAEWRPITPEMNSLRVTMVEELKDINHEQI